MSRPFLTRRAGLADWPGFDLLSVRPGGEWRAIEVKGRAGVGEISENEWAKACNLRESYWLYAVAPGRASRGFAARSAGFRRRSIAAIARTAPLSARSPTLRSGRGDGYIDASERFGDANLSRPIEGKTMPDIESSAIEDDDPIQDEGEDESDDEIADPVRYIIASYGADMPVDGLVERLKKGNIFVPEFQRRFVWKLPQASRFIESLLLGLPVPGIFLFKEPETQKLIVVDGQQRLQTLRSFYAEDFDDRKFRLTGVASEFDRKTYSGLSASDRIRLDDSILHATIFQQTEPGNDRSSIYSVFQRLNTSGTPLTPQEIRACVYRGKLDELLSELAEDPSWRELYGKKNSRKKDEEIILRFFALYFNIKKYERSMKQFLNTFMDENRNPERKREDDLRKLFTKTVKVAAEGLTRKAFRPERAFNVAVADATLVGLARRLKKGEILDYGALRSCHEELLKRLRREDLHRVATADKDRVSKRVRYACEAYESVR